MSASDWRSLRQHREAILLGEISALLHDIGKCTAEFAHVEQARGVNDLDPYKAVFTAAELGAYTFSSQRLQERLSEANEPFAVHRLLDQVLAKLDTPFVIGNNAYKLREAAYFSRPRFAGHIQNALGRPAEALDLLCHCHGEAHAEKEQPAPTVTPHVAAIYSPFGFQMGELLTPGRAGNLTERANNLDINRLTKGHDRSLVTEVFRGALGDTRLPINEVSLWDWSYAVASLYKSELARHFLTGEWRTRDQLRWRLLRINFDVLGLYGKAIKIADLLGYKAQVERACKAVKQQVEEEYPLGNEVYRDTTGIYFTFPDQDLPDELEKEIRQRVESIEPELAPRIRVGQARGETAAEQLKKLLYEQRKEAIEEIAQPFNLENLSGCWQQLWEVAPEGKWEVCPVCRLRPKREDDEVCEPCEKRRASRTEAWHSDPKQTIWLDELADEKARLALVLGRFGLDDWLSGDLVQTLLVKCDPSTTTFTSKNASPARLRRVWESCERFWEGPVSDIFGKLRDCSRWELLPANPADAQKLRQGAVWDGTLNRQPISVFRVGDHILTVSFCPQKEKPSAGKLRVSWEGRSGNQREEFEIQSVVQPAADLAKYMNYRPTLTLLTSPDQFLALVPAGEALNLASEIRKAYGDEFGKVQNRLPLFLGLVFFQRKTPLFAAMDTARRMVQQIDFCEETWKINSIQNHEIAFDNGYSWNVPTRMADGSDDHWYPYFFVDGHASHFRRAFQCTEGKYKGRRLVHVSELAGSAVKVIPSRFAYLLLEHTAQRFEFDPAQDVMLLDELPRFVRMWEQICRVRDMTDNKLHAVADLLQIKGERWGAGSDEFKGLVETTLRQAGLWEGGEEGVVAPNDVTSGRFHRCLEIYLRILKQRVKEERHDQHATVAV